MIYNFESPGGVLNICIIRRRLVLCSEPLLDLLKGWLDVHFVKLFAKVRNAPLQQRPLPYHELEHAVELLVLFQTVYTFDQRLDVGTEHRLEELRGLMAEDVKDIVKGSFYSTPHPSPCTRPRSIVLYHFAKFKTALGEPLRDFVFCLHVHQMKRGNVFGF